MENCGIYCIRCLISGKRYIGSSKAIRMRWSHHRNSLRRGKHTSPRLQKAWNKHGEAAFVFEVIEECSRDDLFIREQFHIDALKPDYNSMLMVRVITKEMRAKMNAAMRAKMALHTHCRNGHEYTPSNTYVSPRRGERRCKQCNAERGNRLFLSLTPEQIAARKAQAKTRYDLKGFAKHSSPEHIAKIVAKTRGRQINRIAILRSAEVRAAKTHCRNGHEYATVGVVSYNGCRGCKGCRLDAKRRYGFKLKAA